MTELQFKCKDFVYNHHLAVPFCPLVICPDKGIGEPKFNGNLIIDGDNLDALKALLPLYAGKIGCIFIDPPYNTGEESWSYNDNVNAPVIKEWRNSTVGVDDGLRHDKWCAMMWPRIRLLYELLSEDGIFLMHIDENEVERASCIIDEVFGVDPADSNNKSNKLGIIVWDKRNPKGDAQGISYQHEYIILAAKSRSKCLEKRPLHRLKRNAESMIQEGKRLFSNVGRRGIPSDLKGVLRKYNLRLDASQFESLYTADIAAEEFAEWVNRQESFAGGERPYNKLDSEGNVYRLVHMGWPSKKEAPEEYFTPIKHPITRKNCPTPKRGWRFPPDTIKTMLGNEPPVREPRGYIRQGEIVFGKDETTQPQRIYQLKDHGSENIPSILRFGGSDDRYLDSIGIDFPNPKPHKFTTELIQGVCHIDDLVLDSFAGSGTIGHAVLCANKTDAGNRRFILVQMDEGEGKANADSLTAERMRKVILGVDGVDDGSTGIGGSFTYCTLGDPIELDKLLTGENLPSWKSLGTVLFHMATNRSLNPATVRENDCYLGGGGNLPHVWLIYRPDLDWLKSSDAALTLARAKQFAGTDPDNRHLVFAAARYVSQKMLDEQNVPVEFVPLPYALFRIERR
ncbi:MAG: site-specific DNA-methyltransferase [Chloroflexota bacterium]|nr:site-specific DNA-methyltransferase [Chloroflexota bacterium]MDE2950525.1 site-specific DNA-methyltransferase [Chloroflexota bacterium]